MSLSDDARYAILQAMPKVELHAHLNGSVSRETLAKIIKTKPMEKRKLFEEFELDIEHGNNRTLKECFEMFKLVHQIVVDYDSIYIAVCDVIREFAEDNVAYLELRSTPRHLPENGITQKGYMETVLRGIKNSTARISELAKYDATKHPIIVRYIPAIDRRNSVEHARETLSLALEFKEKTGLVVGLDLSGDGTINDATNFIPIFAEAKSKGLKLALHLAEVDGLQAETDVMLDLPPDRIGHGTCIHPDYGGTVKLLEKTRKANIPLELCLTSNVKGQITLTFDAHHFLCWYKLGHPISICTDDKGVFSTHLSQEYLCVSQTFKLSFVEMSKMARSSIEQIFESEDVKQRLKQYYDSWQSYLDSASFW